MADRLTALLAVALCVAALGVAAASLSASPLVERGSGEGSGLDDAPSGQSTPAGTAGESLPETGVPPWIVSTGIALVFGLGLPTLLFARGRQILAAATAVLVVVLVVGVFGGGSPPQPPEAVANGTAGMEGGGSGSESAVTDSGGTPLVTFGAVVMALLTAAGLFVYASSGTDAEVDADGDGAGPDREAVAAAAGRVADQIESGVDRSNAVYEAWADMTAALDIAHPETSTPGEFADAAVAAGMDAGDVAEITRLFEAVRYGDAPPSDERERRAVDALRRIEDRLDATSDDGSESE